MERLGRYENMLFLLYYPLTRATKILLQTKVQIDFRNQTLKQNIPENDLTIKF